MVECWALFRRLGGRHTRTKAVALGVEPRGFNRSRGEESHSIDGEEEDVLWSVMDTASVSRGMRVSSLSSFHAYSLPRE